jgi:hypothetical protein
METINIILEIIKYTLPSFIVFFTAHTILKQWKENEEKKGLIELRKQTTQQINPLRLQAYERAVLFLERISPPNLIMRISKSSVSAGELHTELLNTIRAEFEHNLTQQVYMNTASWEALKRGKEETIKLINISAAKINASEDAVELSKIILETAMQMEKLPTQLAIDVIKSEVRTLF